MVEIRKRSVPVRREPLGPRVFTRTVVRNKNGDDDSEKIDIGNVGSNVE